MEEQKRFQKQKLNSNDNKKMEKAAKIVKGFAGLALGIVGYLYMNNNDTHGGNSFKNLKK